MLNRQVVTHKTRMRPVAGQGQFAVAPHRNHCETAGARQIQRHLQGEGFKRQRVVGQGHMDAG
ncbi:hypothetical protein D3C76_1832700 [compost metagenome]